MKHWIENIAEELSKRDTDKHVIASGTSISTIPCPDGCCDNFVEHFEKPFLGVMDAYGIEIEHKSGFEMYKSGVYNDYIRTALENVDRIKEIFNQYRREPLADDWLPYNPICEECGRVNTTYAYDYMESGMGCKMENI